MSFRETRNFCEVLRTLGYPRLVSLESFVVPNFVLVAEIIEWLLRKYDSNIELPDEIEKESDRINFITRSVEIVAHKAKIKLNPKKLYNADGRAVQELLKFAVFLFDSLKASNDALKNGDNDRESNEHKVTRRLEEIRRLRDVPSEILVTGKTLVNLLQSEINSRDFRDKAILYLESSSRDVSGNGQQKLISDVQRLLAADSDELKRLQEELQSLESDGREAKETYEREKEDATRTQRRLQQLQTSKPAFWHEYEEVERQLEDVYSEWVEKMRNLDFLEAELTALMQTEEREAAEFERELKEIQKKNREEEWRQFRGELTTGEDKLPHRSTAAHGGFGHHQARDHQNYDDVDIMDDDESGDDLGINLDGSEAGDSFGANPRRPPATISVEEDIDDDF